MDLSTIKEMLAQFGPGAGSFGVIVYLLHKIATNHLKHIGDDIKELGTKLTDLAIDVKDIKAGCGPCHERIAKLEGKTECMVSKEST
jgi:hypothetical protein